MTAEQHPEAEATANEEPLLSSGEGASEAPEEAYFEEDRLLVGDDERLDVEKSVGIYRQKELEGVVAWEVVNLYNEDGSLKAAREVRSSPPVFRISSSDGASAEFVLSKALSADLEQVFQRVNAAFYGVDKAKSSDDLSQKSFSGLWQGLQHWASAHRVLLSIILVLVALFLFSLFS